VDEIFRCLSGSVAVSAYELESIPLPNYKDLSNLNKLISKKAPQAKIEKEIIRLYNFK
jgi:adenine-specific DNA-methyltransferase